MAYRGFVAVLGVARLISHNSLTKVAVIEVPGPKGERFDYLTIDAEDHYLLSGHLGPGILYVVDMRTNKLVKAIPGLPGITGLEYVPGLHKGIHLQLGRREDRRCRPSNDVSDQASAHRIEAKWNCLRRAISKGVRRQYIG